MKKKILLFLVMLIATVTVLTLSVSAATAIPEWTEVIDVTVVSENVEIPIDISALEKSVQSDNQSRVMLVDGNGNYQTYLSKYITQFKGGYGDSGHFSAYFDALNKATGKQYGPESIVCIEMPEGVLKVSGTYTQPQYWTNVMLIKAPSTITYQQGKSFNSCPNIKVIDYSLATLTNLEQEFITNNSSVEVIRFPANIQKIGKWAIHGTGKLEAVYISGTVTSAEGMLNNNSGGGKFVFFYTGEKPQDGNTTLYTILGDSNIVEIEWDSTKDDSYYVSMAKNDGKKYIVYGYNTCKAFYEGNHDYKGDGNCTHGVSCTQCADNIEGFSDHVYSESIVYSNGFTTIGLYNKYCKNASDCTVGLIKDEEREPIFKALADNGYSTNGDGIAFGGFVVNTGALKEFNSVNEDDITFGIIVANPKYLGNTFMNGSEVNATSGYLKVDMTSDEYTNIKIMLDGFTGKAQSLELVITLYAYAGNGDVQYIQSEDTECANSKVTKEDATLYTVTLDSVENKPYKNNLDALPEYKKDEQ